VPRLVSTVIPTYNRRKDVVIAVESALAQTYSAQEVIVVDDGSTDGTSDMLRAMYGDRLCILDTERLGVSGARNHGMSRAVGAYIALLDSDDEWAPDKLARQVEFLETRPDFQMVLTDVIRINEARHELDRLNRRAQIPRDGDVLSYVLRQPALAPSSALFRRTLLDDVGGFDRSLRTAEDIDFHLRVALRHKIGVIDAPLTRCMRGHEGLSALPRTYVDYLYVMERFVRDHRDEIPLEDRRAALREASRRNLGGLAATGQWGPALTVGSRAAARVRTTADAAAMAKLASLVLRIAARRVVTRIVSMRALSLLMLGFLDETEVASLSASSLSERLRQKTEHRAHPPDPRGALRHPEPLAGGGRASWICIALSER
jgi:glycosyltransferase involved in cell wall biosynthesis